MTDGPCAQSEWEKLKAERDEWKKRAEEAEANYQRTLTGTLTESEVLEIVARPVSPEEAEIIDSATMKERDALASQVEKLRSALIAQAYFEFDARFKNDSRSWCFCGEDTHEGRQWCLEASAALALDLPHAFKLAQARAEVCEVARQISGCDHGPHYNEQYCPDLMEALYKAIADLTEIEKEGEK